MTPERHPPTAMHPDAFHGPAGAFVQHVEPHTESDPAAVLVQLLVMFGNALGRAAGFKVGFTEHWCNESAAIVGLTSTGRKGTAGDLARYPIVKAAPGWGGRVANGGLVSGEGLIFHVRDERYEKRKAKTKAELARGDLDVDGCFVELVDEGVSDKRLMVVEPELSSVLRVIRRETNTLSGVLRSAWDGLTPLRVLAKNSSNIASEAHISFIGHVTEHELAAELAETEAHSGFVNRHLWVCSRRSKLLPDGPEIVGMSDYIEAFKSALDRGDRPRILERDEQARSLWHQVYPALTGDRECGGTFGAAVGRAEAHTMRLAVIYAVLDKAGSVRVEHLRAALAVWGYCEQSAAYLFDGQTGDPLADRLLGAIGGNGGATKRELYAAVDGHAAAGRLDVALGRLAAAGLAEGTTEQTGGRPRERWILRAERLEVRAKPEICEQSPPGGDLGAEVEASEPAAGGAKSAAPSAPKLGCGHDVAAWRLRAGGPWTCSRCYSPTPSAGEIEWWAR